MNRQNIISEIDLAYKRIDIIIRYSHLKIAKKILKKLYYKSIDIDYTKGINTYFDKIIVIMHYESKYMEAIILIKNRLLIYKKNNNKVDLARLYFFLGSILSWLNDYDSSSYYLKKSLELTINEDQVEIKTITLAFLSLSNNYLLRKDFDKSLNYIELGLSYYKDFETIENNYFFYLYLILGKINILFLQNKGLEVKKVFKTIDKKNKAIGIKEKSLIDKIEIELILENDTYDSLKFIEKCTSLLKIIENFDDEGSEIDIYTLLKTHYINVGDYKNALKSTNSILKKLDNHQAQTSILQATDFDTNKKNNSENEFVIFNKSALSLASKYQTNFFENSFQSSKLNINTIYNSAKTVSGDYLGTFNLDKDGNYYLFVLADAVCEGITGTYISFMLDGIIKSIIFNADVYDVKKIVKDINHILTESLNSQGFVSLWIGLVDINKNTLESLNAGYVPTYLLSKNNETKELNKGSTILGMFSELPEIESETVKFAKGDSILTFSEGVKKTIDYSENNFNEVLNKYIRKYSEDKSIDFNKYFLKNFEKYKKHSQVEDDISCLVVDYK